MKRIYIIFILILAFVATASGTVIETDALECKPTGIAMSRGGKLFAALHYAGGSKNGICIIHSENHGADWENTAEFANASRGVLWRGFAGELRCFLTIGESICMSVCANPDTTPSAWSEAVPVAKGYCSSTPVVLRNGAILLPVYLFESNGPGVLISMDRGRSWMAKPSGITLEEKLHNQTQEPILVPYRNGRVAMLNRATGYQWRWKSVSKTFGQSWDTAEKFIYSPDTPMSVTVLPSGRWLAIKNGRLDQMLYYIPDRLIAYMSDDEGETWYGDLLIDDRRDAVSPCVCAPGDGYIYILYSYAPVIGAEREIRFVKTSEMEINGAAPSRNMTATTNSVIVKSIQALKTFEKETAAYTDSKGKASGDPLTVATFNIEYRNPKEKHPWEERLEFVDAIFRAHNFDVVGVQEPFRPEYDDLCARLGDSWDSIFACTNLEKDDFSNSIFWRKERIEKLDDGLFWYTENPGQKGGFGGASSRNCIWAKLRDKTTGNIFFIFNSHFDFISFEAQLVSARLLMSKVREIAGGYPVICTGDLNATDDNQACMFLAEGPFLKDSMTGAKKSVNTQMSTMGRCNPPEKLAKNSYHIDHIYYTPGLSRVDYWEILSEEHRGLWGASDHNPIMIKWQILK
jgi:endonuclease/exonuclease/phosphatase family metal-dependent hydrolase